MERLRRLSPDCSSAAASGAFSAAVEEKLPCLYGYLTPPLVKTHSFGEHEQEKVRNHFLVKMIEKGSSSHFGRSKHLKLEVVTRQPAHAHLLKRLPGRLY